MGRFTFETHRGENQEGSLFDTARDVFPPLTGPEWYKTRGFKEIGLIYGTTEESYRKTTALINRIRHQAGATPGRTLREASQSEGQRIMEYLEQQAKTILQAHHFTPEGRPAEAAILGQLTEPAVMSCQSVAQAIAACPVSPPDRRQIKHNPVVYENPEETVNISVDDVGAKKQKEHRDPQAKGQRPAAETKYVHTTVAHIEHGGNSYTLAGGSVVGVLRLVIAFVLHNGLLKYRLQFFVDGPRTLQAAILHALAWVSNLGLILDWYHLEEKCQMQLSLAMKGRAIRNQVLKQVTHWLWYGGCDRAIAGLHQVDPAHIKNKKEFDKLIGYIERNKPYIPCYAVRKHLGLRNSSNRGEKMNDLVVSERQKHQGMSWSRSGSVALAVLTALKINQEHPQWFEKGEIDFKLAA